MAPSPYNPSADFPHDIYVVLNYLALYAAIHWTLKRYTLKPLVEVLLDMRDSRKAASKARRQSIANGKSVQAGGKGHAQGNGTVKPAAEQTESEKAKQVDAAKYRRYEEGKFMQSAWNCICHVVLTYISFQSLRDQDWTFDMTKWFAGWPHGMDMDDNNKLMYHMYTAYTVYSWFDIVTSTSARQKDFVGMMVHHSTTFFLCSFSYYLGFHRAGAIIMFIHDVSDPPMEFAKLALYNGFQSVADALFLFFAVVFMYTRVWLFPRYVILAVWIYAPRKFPDGSDGAVAYYSILAGLLALLVLHVYWSWLILVMVYKAVTVGKVEGDVRDEIDDD